MILAENTLRGKANASSRRFRHRNTNMSTAAIELEKAPQPERESLRECFLPGVILLAAIIFAFFPLLSKLPDIWFADDGYYSHGVLVPFISAFMVYKWWPTFTKTQPKPFYPAVIVVVAATYLFWVSYRADVQQFMSASFVIALLAGAWLVFGFRWALLMTLPILYLIFMLPVWTGAIDNYTNTLQQWSTEASFGMLKIMGLEPLRDSSTIIMLDHFTLDVGVPCSGFKLVLAVTAFNLFFMAIARLGFWGNLIMIGATLPLCLFINGLRIALIGVVGNQWGNAAGHQFHDYSGYITLLVCFFILFKLARLLGWKD
jgi:exosortase